MRNSLLNKILFILLFTLPGVAVTSQVIPANGAKLYHTQILFEYPAIPNKTFYSIKVYEGKQEIYSAKDSSAAHLAKKIFRFGKKYRWQYEAYNSANLRIFQSPFYTFSTRSCYFLKPENYLLTVNRYKPDEYLPGLILADNNMVYNRDGEPVFFLTGVNTLCRDFRINRDGNITILDTTILFETNLKNEKLRTVKEVRTDTYVIKNFHHGLIKLKNGNLLCTGFKHPVAGKFPMPICSIVELDRNGKLVWIWSEEDHYLLDTNAFKGSHMNAICISPDERFVYVSNRDLSSILKIDRSTGKVLWSIGYDMGNDIPFISNTLFARQHHVTLTRSGNLMVLNNSLGAPPFAKTSVVEFREPNPETDQQIEPVWTYEFAFEEEHLNFVMRMGGAYDLENGNRLVATGVFNRVFELNQNGEIVWESLLNRRDSISGVMGNTPVYRAAFASSLFPSWFTVECNNRVLTVYNEGTEDDRYEIRSNGKSIWLDVKRESSQQIKLNDLHPGEKVEVIPVSNPMKKRTCILR